MRWQRDYLSVSFQEPPKAADHISVFEMIDDELDRHLVRLRYRDDLTLDAIAERLGVHRDTVRNRINKALDRLRLKLKREGAPR